MGAAFGLIFSGRRGVARVALFAAHGVALSLSPWCRVAAGAFVGFPSRLFSLSARPSQPQPGRKACASARCAGQPGLVRAGWRAAQTSNASADARGAGCCCRRSRRVTGNGISKLVFTILSAVAEAEGWKARAWENVVRNENTAWIRAILA